MSEDYPHPEEEHEAYEEHDGEEHEFVSTGGPLRRDWRFYLGGLFLLLAFLAFVYETMEWHPQLPALPPSAQAAAKTHTAPPR